MRRTQMFFLVVLLNLSTAAGAKPSSQPASQPAKKSLTTYDPPTPILPTLDQAELPTSQETKEEPKTFLAATPPLAPLPVVDPSLEYRRGPSVSFWLSAGGTLAGYGLLGAYALFTRPEERGPSVLLTAGFLLATAGPGLGHFHRGEIRLRVFESFVRAVPTLVVFDSVIIGAPDDLFFGSCGLLALDIAYDLYTAHRDHPGKLGAHPKITLLPTPLPASVGFGLSLVSAW